MFQIKKKIVKIFFLVMFSNGIDTPANENGLVITMASFYKQTIVCGSSLANEGVRLVEVSM